MRILLVEDQRDMRELLHKRLKKEYSVDSCKDGEEALDYLSVYTYDIVLLDIMLPKLDGISVLKWIRDRRMPVPVLLLTAKSSVEDRVAGLDCGANDYLVKPFSYEELLARIRVLVRRETRQLTSLLKVGDLELNTASKEVKRNGQEIFLTSKEYMLLEYMMYNPNILLTRSQLEERAWDSTFEGSSNIVDVYIRYLRKKIDEGHEHKMITTVRGQGYRLEGKKNA